MNNQSIDHSDETPKTKRDSADMRDRIYQPALNSLPPRWLPRREHINIRTQHREGACTGFGLAAVIDYQASERHARNPSVPYEPVSARMLYEMARRHDQWPGERYEGSSARGAMKGWHKNGVCPESDWAYIPGEQGYLTHGRQTAALACPLGAYYRVMPKRSDLHAALTEVPAVFATARTHKGWRRPGPDGVIGYRAGSTDRAGHAFAILGYTEEGFIIQNSWGDSWGGFESEGTVYSGCAIWLYEDFEENIWDAWVARMALPVSSLRQLVGGEFAQRGGTTQRVREAPPRHEIRDHYVHIDDGKFDPFGDYPSYEAEVSEIVGRALGGGKKHLLLYAHGGLNSLKGSAVRAGKWRRVFEDAGVHEIHIIWETGLWAELRDVILGKEDLVQERAGGFGDWWDRIVERAAQPVGHALWKEMQSDADLAFQPHNHGTRLLEFLIQRLEALPENKRPKIHLVGHSAGSILFGHLLTRWKALSGPRIENLVLFAPACTHDFFTQNIRPALKGRSSDVRRLHHFLLSESAELDDSVFTIYRKSLLYLVARSFEDRKEVVPIMGMEKDLKDIRKIGPRSKMEEYVAGRSPKTTSTTHGGFDNDLLTMNSMMEIITGEPKPYFRKSHLEGY